jgi:hypothetical protein
MLGVMNPKYLLPLNRSAVNSSTSRIILNIAVHILKETNQVLVVSLPQTEIFTVEAGLKV